ncbi:cupin domain-containing protein [Azoarcus sp. L1K30]|uniref:cupin domain-containing protein n=1 Tax=Azoarcus sp. L1K30 TaxID=2820277 RepID=UPI001B811628|nr:cupin domain-containing protein [Azoarcus sp. L1K30]MBR0567179.1 cupin domain-containing protein [Azoarcus sp. L1K30]
MTSDRTTHSKSLPSASGNLFADADGPDSAERFLPLLQSDTTCIERIVSHGCASPPGFWYDQPDDEWVMVVRGRAELVFDDGRSMSMAPGDWVTIPARCRHRVDATTPDTIWLAVHIRHLPGNVSCA